MIDTREIEYRLISSIVGNQKYFNRVAHLISEASFTSSHTREIYCAIKKHGIETSVIRSVIESETFELFNSILENYTQTSNVVSMARRLGEERDRREVKERVERLLTAVSGPNSSIKEALADFNSSAAAILSRSDDGTCGIKHIRDLALPLIEMYQADKKNPCPSLYFDPLDKIVGGVRPTELIIIGARPGVGKTALALQCAVSAANAGRRVAYFTLEMSNVECMSRIVCTSIGTAREYVLSNQLSTQKMDRFITDISKKELYLCDIPSIDASRIKIEIENINAVSEKNIDMVFIDHLHIMKPEGKHNNRTSMFSEISWSLKSMAKTMNIPVIALAQLSRESAKRSGKGQEEEFQNKPPILSDLRESGTIEQDADKVIMLHRPHINSSSGEEDFWALVEKNRNGKSPSKASFTFRKETLQFVDNGGF